MTIFDLNLNTFFRDPDLEPVRFVFFHVVVGLVILGFVFGLKSIFYEGFSSPRDASRKYRFARMGLAFSLFAEAIFLLGRPVPPNCRSPIDFSAGLFLPFPGLILNLSSTCFWIVQRNQWRSGTLRLIIIIGLIGLTFGSSISLYRWNNHRHLVYKRDYYTRWASSAQRRLDDFKKDFEESLSKIASEQERTQRRVNFQSELKIDLADVDRWKSLAQMYDSQLPADETIWPKQ